MLGGRLIWAAVAVAGAVAARPAAATTCAEDVDLAPPHLTPLPPRPVIYIFDDVEPRSVPIAVEGADGPVPFRVVDVGINEFDGVPVRAIHIDVERGAIAVHHAADRPPERYFVSARHRAGPLVAIPRVDHAQSIDVDIIGTAAVVRVEWERQGRIERAWLTPAYADHPGWNRPDTPAVEWPAAPVLHGSLALANAPCSGLPFEQFNEERRISVFALFADGSEVSLGQATLQTSLDRTTPPWELMGATASHPARAGARPGFTSTAAAHAAAQRPAEEDAPGRRWWLVPAAIAVGVLSMGAAVLLVRRARRAV